MQLVIMEPRHAYHPPAIRVPQINTAFQPSGQHQQPQQQSSQPSQFSSQYQGHDGTNRARQYKSRNKRPCDFCRFKRAACHLDTQPPCELCIRYKKECTFVDSPAKRRRGNDSASENKQHRRSESGFKPTTDDGMVTNTSAPFVAPAISGIDLQENMMWQSDIPPFELQISDDMGNDMSSQFFNPTMSYEPIPSFSNYDNQLSVSPAPTDHNRLHAQQRPSMDAMSPLSPLSAVGPSLQPPSEGTIGEPSLDRQKSSNSQIIGLSGESDPYLFSKFRFDKYHEAVFNYKSIRVRGMNDGPNDQYSSIPTFFNIQENRLADKAQPQDKSNSVEKWRSKIEEMVAEDEGKRLFQLFYRYVQPYYPVLTHDGSGRGELLGTGDPGDISPCVLAAVYGHALPFLNWDDKLCVDVGRPEFADALFTIAWNASLSLVHTPNISVIQALLLLVQRRPTNPKVSDTPFKWVMMSSAVALAQVLGLNRDPTDWPIPAWEKQQRKRLGWAVFVQDKWLSLNSGRSSHLQSDDWDLPPLTEEDFPEADRKAGENSHGGPHPACQHFIKLCELTMIIDDVYRDLFSVRTARQLHGSLDATLEKARPLLKRVEDWFRSLPAGLLPLPSREESSTVSPIRKRRASMQYLLNGNGSLQLAYITAKIVIFRAILRPRTLDGNVPGLTKIRANAIEITKEICTFVESLNEQFLGAFWASYARPNFTIASSFFVLLFVTSPSLADAKACLGLLNTWRDLLRIKSPSCNLLELALIRLNSLIHALYDKRIEITQAAQQAWNEAEPST